MVLVVIVGMASAPAVRADNAEREYQVKAAFIYNFAQFVEWPEDAFESQSAPIVIGVLGKNPFADSLERAVGGKSIHGRSLTIRYFSKPDELTACHMLYVSPSETGRLSQIFQQLQNKPVLTIGEVDPFLWSGGVIRFYNDDNKIRFEVNLEAAERGRLKISSKLLKLAKIFKK